MREKLDEALTDYSAADAAEQEARVTYERALAVLTEARGRSEGAAARVLALVPPLRPMEERYYWHGRQVVRLRRYEGQVCVGVIDPL